MRTDWFKVAEGVTTVVLAALAIAFMAFAVTRDEDSRPQIYQTINEVGTR